MADFLKLGGTAVPVDESSFTELEPALLGTEDRADDGALRTSVRGQKQAWAGATPPLPFADVQAIKALAPLGTFVVATGAFLNGPAWSGTGGTSVTVSVRFGAAKTVGDRAAPASPSFKVVQPFTLTEV